MSSSGLQVEQIDPASRRSVHRFVDVPFRVYQDDSNWVPPLRRETALALDRRRHPYYEHSDAAFFVARRDGVDVGRLAALEHRPYNQWHEVAHASFGFLECQEGDDEAARALFGRLFDWAAQRGLTRVVGPRGLSAFDGYGLLIRGFDRRQLMTMTNYNPPWYERVVEGLGFEKEVDFVTYELDRATFVMPDTVRRAAERAADTLRIVRYPSRRALMRAARSIGQTYNQAFVRNWEYYPLSDREIDFTVEQIRPLADHRLMTFIAAGDDIVGFVLAFADVSRALQRIGGRLTPWGIARLLAERRRTVRVALNGAGILPEYRGRGGNALLYMQIERAVRSAAFTHAELPQVAETAERMRRDLQVLGARPIKTHRVYRRDI
jgi:hypothetical protein